MGLMQSLEQVFPRLNLQPTMESTMIKLAEESGELAELIGKARGMSGENQCQVIQKLISRDMGREIAEVMGQPGAPDLASLQHVIAKYQDLRLRAERGEFGQRDIHTWIARELLDVMQTCATFAYQLDVDLDRLLASHRAKLVQRGYLAPGGCREELSDAG